MMRSYSSRVRPRSRARSGVAFGSAPVNPSPKSALQEAAVLDQAAEERLEDQHSVGAAHRALGGTLGVRHQAENGPLLVDDARDVLQGAVGICRSRHLAICRGVPEDDLVALLELGQGGRVAVILA